MNKIIYAVGILAVAVVVGAYVNVIIGGEGEVETAVIVDASNLEMVALGEKVYAENCSECHGKDLEGQPNWRNKNPDGTLPAPPHDATGHTWHHNDASNFKYTKFGGQASAPANFTSAMPDFGEALSDREILAALSFIKSKWPEDIRDRHRRMSERMK